MSALAVASLFQHHNKIPLFRGDVDRIANGLKTQFRFPIDPQPRKLRKPGNDSRTYTSLGFVMAMAYCDGDHVWPEPGTSSMCTVSRKPGGPDGYTKHCEYQPGHRFMIAKRCFEITEIRIHQLRAILPQDAIAEGLDATSIGFRNFELNADNYDLFPTFSDDPVLSYLSKWRSHYGYGSASLSEMPNPWLWAVSFVAI